MQFSNLEDTYFPANYSIRVGDKLIDLSTPIVMAIVNATPDSFYAGNRLNTIDSAIERIEIALQEGAKIVDIGGYSTRPEAEDISVKEELNRVLPVIQETKKRFPDAVISIDTFRSEVADAALNEGATIVNDISGFEIDPKIVETTVKHKAAYILMHMKGTPQTMKQHADYHNLFVEIASYFSKKIQHLIEAGVHDIILDPGYGFAKTTEQNHLLLQHQDFLQQFDLPILTGISRKSMIYRKLDSSASEALNGTTALHALALKSGSKILRVHDVKEAVEVIRLLNS